MDQAEKVAIVTGAASGIGAACVRLLEADGVTVIGFDAVAGGDAMLAVDVGDRAAVEAGVAEVIARHGRIDMLVNSAGTGTLGTILDLAVEDWERVLRVNLTGSFLMCRTVLPHMVARGSGAIVNIGSTFGLVARDNGLAYNVSKAGVIHMTRSIAVDLADSGVRVNCVCPGLVETGMTARLYDEEAEAILARNHDLHALRRSGQPDEIAQGVVFLLSDRASFITGAAVPVDGGYTSGKWTATI